MKTKYVNLRDVSISVLTGVFIALNYIEEISNNNLFPSQVARKRPS